jgi:hypothetical protein
MDDAQTIMALPEARARRAHLANKLQSLIDSPVDFDLVVEEIESLDYLIEIMQRPVGPKSEIGIAERYAMALRYLFARSEPYISIKRPQPSALSGIQRWCIANGISLQYCEPTLTAREAECIQSFEWSYRFLAGAGRHKRNHRAQKGQKVHVRNYLIARLITDRLVLHEKPTVENLKPSAWPGDCDRTIRRAMQNFFFLAASMMRRGSSFLINDAQE